LGRTIETETAEEDDEEGDQHDADAVETSENIREIPFEESE